MGDRIRLFSYKMTNDTGFAPNPFWGYLTIATCKPGFRRSKRVGDWILGFSSKSLTRRYGVRLDDVGEEKLIFAMKVSERLTTREYWLDYRFRSKKPSASAQAVVDRTGDNIYEPLVPEPSTPTDFKQLPNPNHGTDAQSHDLKAMWILAATEFWYFGSGRIALPEDVRPLVPVGQSAYGKRTYDEHRIAKFLNYLSKYPKGVNAAPHKWPENDDSWRQ